MPVKICQSTSNLSKLDEHKILDFDIGVAGTLTSLSFDAEGFSLTYSRTWPRSNHGVARVGSR